MKKLVSFSPKELDSSEDDPIPSMLYNFLMEHGWRAPKNKRERNQAIKQVEKAHAIERWESDLVNIDIQLVFPVNPKKGILFTAAYPLSFSCKEYESDIGIYCPFILTDFFKICIFLQMKMLKILWSQQRSIMH